MVFFSGTPHHNINGIVRNAPPADTKPLITPITRPTKNNGKADGSERADLGFLFNMICVAPKSTITEKLKARCRCGIQADAIDASSPPIMMPGIMRLTMSKSTPSNFKCARTLALEVNTLDAMLVASAIDRKNGGRGKRWSDRGK